MRAEAGSDGDNFVSSFQCCESHVRRADRVNDTLQANWGCTPLACDTARNSQNSLVRDIVVHDAMQHGISSSRKLGNSKNSGGDTDAGGRGVCDNGEQSL